MRWASVNPNEPKLDSSTREHKAKSSPREKENKKYFGKPKDIDSTHLAQTQFYTSRIWPDFSEIKARLTG